LILILAFGTSFWKLFAIFYVLRILSVDTSISTTNMNGEYVSHAFRLEIAFLKKMIKTKKMA